MPDRPRVSIIIPVFNVEAYLRECLDSVLRQTVREWECICIDDGSPDGSGAILEEYGARDARFKIIRQPNRGVAVARNQGLERARAPYLTFIDSDDWLEPSALECLLASAEEHSADIVMCAAFIHHSAREGVDVEAPYSSSGDLPEAAVSNRSFSGDALVDVSCWAKLFKTEIITRNRVLFIRDLKISEDMEFSTRMLCHSRRISILRTPLYHYRGGHEGSIIHNIVSGRLDTADFISSIHAVYQLYKCVPSGLKGAERRECVTGTLRRALSGKAFYRQVIRRLDRKNRAAILSRTSFPYLHYLREGKKMVSLVLILRHLRMQVGFKTRLQSLLNRIGSSFQR